MGIDELLISTGVDTLIKYVHDKKRVEIEKVALDLNLPFKTVEEWAKALENDNIIRIEYKFTKIYLVWAEGSSKSLINSIGDVSEARDKMETLLAESFARLKSTDNEIIFVEDEYKKLINNLMPKIQDIESKVVKLSKLGDDADDVYTDELKRFSELKSAYLKLILALDAKHKEWDNLSKQIEGPEFKIKGLEIVDSFKDNLLIKRNEVLTKLKEFNARVETDRKDLEKAKKLSGDVQHLSAKIHEFNEMQNDLDIKLEGVRSKQMGLEKMIIKFTGQSDPKKGIEIMRSELMNVHGSVEQITTKVQDMSHKITSQMKVLNQLSSSYQDLKETHILDKLSNIEQKQTDFNNKLDELKMLHEKIKSSTKLGKEIDEGLKSLELIGHNIESERDQIVDNFEDIERDFDDKMSHLVSLDDKYTSLESQTKSYLQKLKTESNDYRGDLKTIQSEEKQITDNIDKYKIELNTYSKYLKAWATKYKNMLAQRDNASKVLTEIREIKQMKNKLEGDLVGLRKKFKLLDVVKKNNQPVKVQSKVVLALNEQLEDVKQKEDEINVKKDKLRDMMKNMWGDDD